MSVEAVIKAARGEIGYRESGTNYTKFNRWLGYIPGYPHGGYGYPWCHSFVSWCLAQGGEAAAGPRTASCEVGVAWFRARGRYSRMPRRGDLVYYGPGGGTHVELVVDVSAGTITTIGGNTSGSLGGRYFNGNGVYRKTVSRSSSRIHGYGHPIYQEDDMPSEKEIYEAVWRRDVVPVPDDYAKKDTNPKWWPETMLRDTNAKVREMRRALDAQAATIDKLVDAVAAGPGVDLEALKAEIRRAIESVSVRLDVEE